MNIIEEDPFIWTKIFDMVWKDEQERDRKNAISLGRGTVNEEEVVKRVKKIFELLKESK